MVGNESSLATCLARAREQGLGLFEYFHRAVTMLAPSELIEGLAYESAQPAERRLVRLCCWWAISPPARVSGLDSTAFDRLGEIVRTRKLDHFEKKELLGLLVLHPAGRGVLQSLLAGPDVWLAGAAAVELLEADRRESLSAERLEPLAPAVRSLAVEAVWIAYRREREGTAGWHFNDGVHNFVRNRFDLYGGRLWRLLTEETKRGRLTDLDLSVERTFSQIAKLSARRRNALFDWVRHPALTVAAPAREALLVELINGMLPECAEAWEIAAVVVLETLEEVREWRHLALSALRRWPEPLEAERSLPWLEAHWSSLSTEGQLEAALLVGRLAERTPRAAALFGAILTGPPDVAASAVRGLENVSPPLRAHLRSRWNSLPRDKVRTEPSWQALALALGLRLEGADGLFHSLTAPTRVAGCGNDVLEARGREENRRLSAEVVGGSVWEDYRRQRETAEKAEAAQRAARETEEVEWVGGLVAALLDQWQWD